VAAILPCGATDACNQQQLPLVPDETRGVDLQVRSPAEFSTGARHWVKD